MMQRVTGADYQPKREKVWCETCNTYVDQVVSFGKEFDTFVCEKCLSKALKLLDFIPV